MARFFVPMTETDMPEDETTKVFETSEIDENALQEAANSLMVNMIDAEDDKIDAIELARAVLTTYCIFANNPELAKPIYKAGENVTAPDGKVIATVVEDVFYSTAIKASAFKFADGREAEDGGVIPQDFQEAFSARVDEHIAAMTGPMSAASVVAGLPN